MIDNIIASNVFKGGGRVVYKLNRGFHSFEIDLWSGALGVYYESCYSRGRIILTMIFAIVTILDDIYDSYATPKECILFTKCFERFVLLSYLQISYIRFTE